MKYYIGLAMGPASTVETGLAVIEDTGKIILIDKLFCYLRFSTVG